MNSESESAIVVGDIVEIFNAKNGKKSGVIESIDENGKAIVKFESGEKATIQVYPLKDAE